MRTKVIGSGEYVNVVFTALEWQMLRMLLFRGRFASQQPVTSAEAAAMTRVLRGILRAE